MKQCKNCIFYDREYDEMKQSMDDILIKGQEDDEKHYCILYKNGIDADILRDKKQCEDYDE